MAVTVINKERTKVYGDYLVFATIALDNSYPTGGEAVTPQQFGLTTITHVVIDNANGYGSAFDYANNKIKLFSAAAAEVANAFDLSAVTLRLCVYGK